jgi:hypothetical protein
VLTGGTATGLAVLRGMASAQPDQTASGSSKLRDRRQRHPRQARRDLGEGAQRRARIRLATFGDREQSSSRPSRPATPPDVAEMNYQGPMRYKAALRDETS